MCEEAWVVVARICDMNQACRDSGEQQLLLLLGSLERPMESLT
jgi:hypothetical protein